MKILGYTYHLAVQEWKAGKRFDADRLTALDKEVQQLKERHPEPTRTLKFNERADEPWIADAWGLVDVEITAWGIRRIIGPVEPLVEQRLDVIKQIVMQTLCDYKDSVRKVLELLGEWMREHTIVHVIGAGRALLAASVPANRLAHGGANVFILGDKAPPPNSRFGGGIIAASASGETPAVLDIMRFAMNLNKEMALSTDDRWPNTKEIEVIGIANRAATPFQKLCTKGCFLGIEKGRVVALRGLGDIEELAISELLDALIVAAGIEIGVNFFLGHEDLVGGATGPWHQHSKGH